MPKPASPPPGFIAPEILYTVEEVMARLRMGRKAWWHLRDKGVRVIRFGRRNYILGATVIEVFTAIGKESEELGDSQTSAVRIGRYRHYKGKEYSVIGVAHHSESEEELVVYRKEYGDHGLWVRPRGMFLELVEVKGEMVPRFKYLGRK